MALKEYLGATGLTDILTKLKTWVLGEVPKAIPAGGRENYVLAKNSNTDRDLKWYRIPSSMPSYIYEFSGSTQNINLNTFVTLGCWHKNSNYYVISNAPESKYEGSSNNSDFVLINQVRRNSIISSYPIYYQQTFIGNDLNKYTRVLKKNSSSSSITVVSNWVKVEDKGKPVEPTIPDDLSVQNLFINDPEKTKDTYTFHITSTGASTAVAWCNKVAKFSAPSRAETGVAFDFSITVKVGDTLAALAFDNASAITAIYLYDKATAKISNLTSANFTYYEYIDLNKDIVFRFTIAAASVTAANATALNAVIDSASPGFAAIYAANTLNLTGTIKGKGIVEKIPGFPSAFNTFPSVDHITQHVGDFYIPTGGPRWSIDVEVDPGTAYMAVCYLENTTTGTYFNHSICYAGVGVPTIAAPTVAPAPVAGKVIAFVGTTWTPFAAGVAGVVDSGGVVTTKPRLRIVGYHANNAPTAGLGMHIRLFRIY